MTGKVVAINETLEDGPEQVNDDPYDTWLFCIKADDPTELETLMAADSYRQMIEE